MWRRRRSCPPRRWHDALQLPRQQAVDVRGGRALTTRLRPVALVVALAAAALLIGLPGVAYGQGTSPAGAPPGSKPGTTTGAATTTSTAEAEHSLTESRAIRIPRTDPQVAAE